MAKTASMYLRIDPQVKSKVETIIRPSIPNSETLEAIREGDKIIKSGKTRFKNAEDMLAELKA